MNSASPFLRITFFLFLSVVNNHLNAQISKEAGCPPKTLLTSEKQIHQVQVREDQSRSVSQPVMQKLYNDNKLIKMDSQIIENVKTNKLQSQQGLQNHPARDARLILMDTDQEL